MPKPAVIIDVVIEDAGWRRVPRLKGLAERAATAAFAVGLPARVRVNACVALIDDVAIAALNHDFRGQAKPTDVLAFPQLPGGTRGIAARLRHRAGSRDTVALGDVVVALGACTQGARESKVALPDHVAHLIVHGALHLLGHDHAEPGETKRMRTLERAALATLKIADPYRVQTAVTPRARGAERRS